MTTQTQPQPCTPHTAPVCNLVSPNTNLDWVRDWSVWGFDDHGALYADPSDSCAHHCAPLGDLCHAGDDTSFVKAKAKAMAWFDHQCE